MKMRDRKSTIATLKRVLGLMKPYRGRFVLVVIFIILTTLVSIMGTMFIRTAVDSFILPLAGQENPDMRGFLTALGIMAFIYIAGAFFSFCYSRIMVGISTRTLSDVRIKLFRHLQSLPVRYYDSHTHGETMSCFTNDTDTLSDMVGRAIPELASSLITIIGVVIAMLILSPVLTVLVFVMLGVMILFVAELGKVSGRSFVKQQKAMAKADGYIEELVEGQKVVKVFCHEESVKNEFAVINESLRAASVTAHTCANILMPIMGNLSYVLYVVSAVVGSVLIMRPELPIAMTIGSLIAFLQFTRTVSRPIGNISQLFNGILLALAGAGRIFELLDEKKESDDGYVTLVNICENREGEIEECENRTGRWAWKHPHRETETVTYTELKGEVTFDNVFFGYEEGKPVLKGISMYARAGQKVALVGSTGAGKTTVTNLLNRFYDVPDGKIRYDGININKIKKADLRRSLGMVLQDTNLFTGTVTDNIRYGNPDATDEMCASAARLSNAHSFISRLPEGYDTVLRANGSNLSQGQRQLLSIARAAVANPPVLILDEATSSIDTRTEKLIEEGMYRLMQGRTVFIIAHRLSTVKSSDCIMVIEDGKIIERGNHRDLLKQKGRYYKLYTGKAELS